MDFDDTPEEAAVRAEAWAWLEANAAPKGHPDDFSAGIWTSAYTEDIYVNCCRKWQGRLAEGGWAGITWPRSYGGRGGRPIEAAILNQEQARFGVSNGVFAIAIGMVGPTPARPRHRRAEGPLPAGHAPRRARSACSPGPSCRRAASGRASSCTRRRCGSPAAPTRGAGQHRRRARPRPARRAPSRQGRAVARPRPGRTVGSAPCPRRPTR